MSGFYTYFHAQLARVFRLLPALMTVTLLVYGCMGFFAALYLQNSRVAQENRKYRIALTGDVTDSYLGFGISALSMLDDSRFMAEFPVMTEDEARRALISGEIEAYAVIPDELVDSVVYGANDAPVTFVGSTGQKGIIGILVEELAETASTLVTRSQSAIYAMQKVLSDSGLEEMRGEATDTLNLRLIEMVLNRTGLCGLEILGISNGLTTGGYYFCAVLTVSLLFAGISCNPFFGGRNRELAKLMAAKGVGAFRQVAGEYAAYLAVQLCSLTGIFLALWLVSGRGASVSSAWTGLGLDAGRLAGVYVRLLLPAAVLAAMQFLLYELVTGTVSGMILQFTSGMAMAYLSGCFYPAGMFPDLLKQIGGLLPAGLALDCATAGLTGESVLYAGVGLGLYFAVFLGLSVYARACRIQRG